MSPFTDSPSPIRHEDCSRHRLCSSCPQLGGYGTREFSIGADVALVEGAAGCLAETQRQAQQVLSVRPVDVGQEGELVRHADHVSVARRRHPVLDRLGAFCLH